MADNNVVLRTRCRQTSANCVSHFSSVPIIHSDDLVQQKEDHILLVDVRTKAERDVSMIQGAMSLQEFEQRYEEKVLTTTGPKVVFYCTVGFRSGLHARHYANKFPEAKIFNSDGIVAYSQAIAERPNDGVIDFNGLDNSATAMPRPLVRTLQEEFPNADTIATTATTTTIHTFGQDWNFVLKPYGAVWFSAPQLFIEFMRVYGWVVVRTVQHLWYKWVAKKRQQPLQRQLNKLT